MRLSLLMPAASFSRPLSLSSLLPSLPRLFLNFIPLLPFLFCFVLRCASLRIPGGSSRHPELAAPSPVRGTRLLFPALAGEHPATSARERLFRAFFQQASCSSDTHHRFFVFVFATRRRRRIWRRRTTAVAFTTHVQSLKGELL